MHINESESYTCPQCGRTSYNPNDVYHKYCGACRMFEVDMVAIIETTATEVNEQSQ